MNTIQARLRYGVDQDELNIQVETDAEATSISDCYITVHLPDSLDMSKVGWLVEGGKAEVETIFDRKDGTGSVEIKVTAGASADDVKVLVTGSQGNSHNADGETGNAITVDFTL